MALQQLVCCFTVVIIFFCKGCHSEQLACGIRAVNSSNITGDHNAAPGSWPWYADVQVFLNGTANTIFEGSLINDQWVLTDAYIPSFIQTPFFSMVVYLGRNSQLGSNPNEVNRTVVDVTCHPKFNLWTRENDICLLKLSAPVNFTDYIQPICLASENSTFNNETSSWLIGFPWNGILSDSLKEANVSILGNNVCKSSYPWITDSFICTGGKDLCWDNYGAPLMIQSESVWLQIGVLSVPGCGGPLVYTPVSQYQKWINYIVTGPLSTALPTTSPTSPICDSVFCSGENLIHFTHFTSLCVLVVLLHVFAGTVGK